MKPPVIVATFLRVSGMALFPFILVNTKAAVGNKVLVNHELIHIKQQAELLVLPFYLLYLLNYLFNLLKYCDHNKAYLNIVFEREAYINEGNLTYLNTRRFWAWRNYFKTNS